MARTQTLRLAAALALVLGAPAAMAQSAQPMQSAQPAVSHRAPVVHHRIAMRPHPIGSVHRRAVAEVVPPGEIVVHAAQRSYLDPGPPAWYEAGTGRRYVTDSTPSSPLDYRGLGSQFGLGGFETLPTRFNPPGRPEPIVEW
ncbi:MAG: hypothetical protein JO107_00040 [Hyphomicrobiales bacterium]|nr:hypothetical protein [Hyphomicrobiales bacterium]